MKEGNETNDKEKRERKIIWKEVRSNEKKKRGNELLKGEDKKEKITSKENERESEKERMRRN